MLHRVFNEAFWQQYFMLRWGRLHHVDSATKVSPLLPRICSALCLSGDFLVNFIEFGFNVRARLNGKSQFAIFATVLYKYWI